jgi:regulatory protein
MSDASEHLAPVSYLPWATPPDRGAETPTRNHGRDRFGAARGGSGSQRARLTAVPGETPEGRDETGPERDARIDRLVVSRLRRSALSVAEVRAVLAEHGLDEAEVAEWIQRYERLGYLDDARLAEQLVYVNGSRRGRGSVAILQELSRRGVDATAARAAIDELDPEIERQNALAAAERRARQLVGLERQTAERRLSAFLQRRGYSSNVVREAVRAALAVDDS